LSLKIYTFASLLYEGLSDVITFSVSLNSLILTNSGKISSEIHMRSTKLDAREFL